MLKKLMVKVIMGQKERLLALFIEMLENSYNESRDEIAQRVIGFLPDSMKKTATRMEMITFMDTLKNSIASIMEAAKPLYR